MTINKDIETIKDIILQVTPCERIYLFGSYAYGTPHEDSDYDFYVVIPNEGVRPIDASGDIYCALHGKTPYRKPVDILVKEYSEFEHRKVLPTLEKEVANKGVVLYEAIRCNSALYGGG